MTAVGLKSGSQLQTSRIRTISQSDGSSGTTPSNRFWFLMVAVVMFSRNAGVARREGAPALFHDWSADQPEGGASVQPRPAEEEGRLAAGEAAAADGAGPPAAGAGPSPPHCPRAAFHLLGSPLTFQKVNPATTSPPSGRASNPVT